MAPNPTYHALTPELTMPHACRLACEQARELGLNATTFEAANKTFERALEMGLGDSEMATLAKVIEDRFETKIVGASANL